MSTPTQPPPHQDCNPRGTQRWAGHLVDHEEPKERGSCGDASKKRAPSSSYPDERLYFPCPAKNQSATALAENAAAGADLSLVLLPLTFSSSIPRSPAAPSAGSRTPPWPTAPHAPACRVLCQLPQAALAGNALRALRWLRHARPPSRPRRRRREPWPLAVSSRGPWPLAVGARGHLIRPRLARDEERRGGTVAGGGITFWRRPVHRFAWEAPPLRDPALVILVVAGGAHRGTIGVPRRWGAQGPLHPSPNRPRGRTERRHPGVSLWTDGWLQKPVDSLMQIPDKIQNSLKLHLRRFLKTGGGGDVKAQMSSGNVRGEMTLVGLIIIQK
nr:uncharacterized protein LOC127303146 [Lolium perenne]